MAEFKPFADDASAITIGGLTIENDPARISILGSLDVARDNKGLEYVAALKVAIDAILREVETGRREPAQAKPAVTQRTRRKNPFP